MPRRLAIRLGACASVIAAVLGLASVVRSQTPPGNPAKFTAGSAKSGYVYATAQTRAMEDDDFQNPGSLWIDKGKQLWSVADGTGGQSCQSCHNAAETSMRGVGATYPKYDAKVGRVIDIEQRINLERERMGAAPWKWESEQLLAMTVYVKNQSHGMPVAVAIDGPAHATWLQGQAFYKARRGQLDVSCEQCHVQNNNNKLRSETLSQGQINGFPTYRLDWGAVGSVQRRFRGCNEQVRAQPLPYGSPEYVALELYLGARGNGLPVETPAVRK